METPIALSSKELDSPIVKSSLMDLDASLCTRRKILCTLACHNAYRFNIADPPRHITHSNDTAWTTLYP